MDKATALRQIQKEYKRWYKIQNDRYERGWLWYNPICFDQYLESKVKNLEGVYSAWGLTDPVAHCWSWLIQTKYPMKSTLVRSLFPQDAKKALKRWPFLRFHGWQFSRYSRNPQRALAYFSYTPNTEEGENNKEIPIEEYIPCKLHRIVLHGLSNCGFDYVVLTDDANLTLNERRGSESRHQWLTFQRNMQISKANREVRKYCNEGAKATVLDIVVHPSRLTWLKKIRKGPRVQIIIEAHLSKITGHACIRLLLGAESWKTREQIVKKGTTSKLRRA